MSDEEKEAIEYLKNRLDILHNNTQWATEKSIKVVLNLIDKLKNNLYEEQEQNEYLKDKVEKQQKEINKAIEYIENAKKELNGCGNYYLSDLLNILKGELND